MQFLGKRLFSIHKTPTFFRVIGNINIYIYIYIKENTFLKEYFSCFGYHLGEDFADLVLSSNVMSSAIQHYIQQ